MQYQKGLPPLAEPLGDYRGRFGIGRPAHGSDPNAQYSFGAPLAKDAAVGSVTAGDWDADEPPSPSPRRGGG